jgi:ketosteroid isomerase-like protein
MSQENVEIVRRIYEEWATGDFRASFDDLDPHIVFIVGPDFPDAGVFNGTEGVREYMRRFLEQWDRYTLTANEIQAVGDTVIVGLTQRAQGRASGVQTEQSYYHVLTLRAGRIVRLDVLMHERDALKAAGLSEQDTQADS